MAKGEERKLRLQLSTAPLGPRDGVMVLILREEGGREVLFPQLGLMSEGRIEQSVPYMFREIMRVRAQGGRDLAETIDEGDE